MTRSSSSTRTRRAVPSHRRSCSKTSTAWRATSRYRRNCSRRRRKKSTPSTQSTTRTRSASSCSRDSRGKSTAELAAQDLVHLRRVRLPAACFHHLADERVERLLLAGAVVGNLLRICLEYRLYDAVDLRVVGNRPEVCSRDSRRGGCVQTSGWLILIRSEEQ